MSVHAGSPWSYENLKFFGLSLSGIRTSIAMPEFSLSFDVAQGYPFLLNLKKFFITHGHLDHAAGVPYIISQKAMTGQPPGTFYMPPSLVEPLDQIMKLWEKIERHEYNYSFLPVSGGEKIELNQNHFIRPFTTYHRVESFGYTLFETHKKLKPEYAGLSKDEILQLKKKHIKIQQTHETPLVSFTGDTEIEFLDAAPWIKKSKVLFLETTYLDEKKPIEHAKKWGHTHLDELLPRLAELECERIVLIHISSRYSDQEVKKILAQKLPPDQAERIVFFPGR